MSSLQLQPIENTSEEYGISEYLLQLQLDAPHLRISECYDIGNKNVRENFINYVNGLQPQNIVDVFVPVTSLQQPVSDIISHGIRVSPKNGFRFQTGKLQLEAGKETYEVVHITVALGNVYNNQKTGVELSDETFSDVAPTPSAVPEGYNTIRVSENNEFVVFNTTQINSLRLIRFAGGDNLSHEPRLKQICSICGKDNATLWCENDQCKLCEKCDKEAHSQKLTQNHTRKPVSESLIGQQKCPVHPDVNVAYYCLKCHCPVCLECKVKGSHSKGEQAKHRLIDLPKAYEDAQATLSKPNTVFITREKTLNQHLKLAKDKLSEIEETEKQIEAEITRIAAKAIEESRMQSGLRAQAVKSIKLEIERKISELQSQKKLIDAHHNNSEPLEVVQACYLNSVLEKEIINNTDLPSLASNIDAQLQVYGRLEVNPPRSSGKVTSRGLPQPGASGNGDGLSDSSAFSDGIETEETDLEEPDPHITHLSRMAKRKFERRGSKQLPFVPFDGSSIITDPEMARNLYMTFPFKGEPITHRMYYSEEDGRNVSKIHKIVDGHGITCVLVKVGQNLFGGFAASKWNSDGKPFGKGSSSFLFQLTKDAFIPNRGQTEEPICLFATTDTLTFGKYDLALVGNLEKCTSTIENSYGVGFAFDSQKAKTFLAGSQEFRPDVVEVWGFYSSQ
ncbi:B-box zinc finger family protein [Trichomonas vaginalis G3]|uniref:B-box zinc finger family protein n=1 Tax=Trichomonas vaginalis (strain ATCC PRA-98 / G3) TaxID=412133 RepID=A2D9F5_TRIV3|nr:zinc ion binding [Trichomonas vaginalis G3]EAY22811.1 B-box zinc finger family protein [Trichomonas vaginalis G3]KAI5526968.1 zinc ion binding [Trichomonas vaginalis G3]|eukprot:XP_001583797.1 B-box zinc finger family protein [Trichomonas vaginalis G3]